MIPKNANKKLKQGLQTIIDTDGMKAVFVLLFTQLEAVFQQ